MTTINQIMTEAHATAKQIRSEYATYREALAAALRLAHQSAKVVPVVAAPAAPVENDEIRIVVSSQYGRLSRGRHSARKESRGKSVQWAEKDGRGLLVIDEPGVWKLHCSDGFSREARAVLTVREDGNWEMTGDTRRFDVIDE